MFSAHTSEERALLGSLKSHQSFGFPERKGLNERTAEQCEKGAAVASGAFRMVCTGPGFTMGTGSGEAGARAAVRSGGQSRGTARNHSCTGRGAAGRRRRANETGGGWRAWFGPAFLSPPLLAVGIALSSWMLRRLGAVAGILLQPFSLKAGHARCTHKQGFPSQAL